MISRTSGILLVSYILVFLGGFGYLVSPSPEIAGVIHDSEALIWGLFYLAGGLIAAIFTGLRPILLTKITPLWYFEVAGISLIVSANLVHMYALYEIALMTGQVNLLALAAVIIAYTLTLIGRCVEVLSLIRYLSQFALTPDSEG